jgi:hypothetical protein
MLRPMPTSLFLLSIVLLHACAISSRQDAAPTSKPAAVSPAYDVPFQSIAASIAGSNQTPQNPVSWALALRRYCPQWYHAADRAKHLELPWPAGFDPVQNPIYAYNELFFPGVSAEEVFDVLTDARGWPSFYPNSDAVTIDSSLDGSPRLRLGDRAKFHWTTFATRQDSEVAVFKQGRALGWSADSPGTRALHRWILQPRDGGVLVITEECQHGWVAELDRWIMNPALHAAHQLWLERLRRKIAAP